MPDLPDSTAHFHRVLDATVEMIGEQKALADRLRGARVRASRARALSIQAWWPLSWTLRPWAAALDWRVRRLESRASAARAVARSRLDEIDLAHRSGRRALHRQAPGSR